MASRVRAPMQSPPSNGWRGKADASLSERGTASTAALAVGALGVGTLAIGRLAIGRARIRRLEIDELVVRNLRVIDELQLPPRPGAENQSPFAR